MKMLKYILIVMVIIAIASCKKDQYYLFNDMARIQFGPDATRIYTASYNLADTLKPFTFYYEMPSVTEDTVFFDIYAIGGVSKTDRNFTLKQEQVANVNNAVAGTHFVPFTDPRVNKFYTIKAGTVHTSVPVIVLRDPSLKTNTVVLKLDVVADGNFQPGEQSNLWRKVQITDRLSQPASWNASFSQYYFGKYSIVKHAFMIQATGQKWDETFIAVTTADYALLQYYVGAVKTSLVDYNKNHPGNPLTDESGELVVIP